jgi:ribosomal protein S18 acetylase RimI-like enzyme
LTLPKLTPNIQEMPYQADQLSAATYVDARAFGATEQEAEMRADMRETDPRYILESTVQTWTGLACEGKLIGFAFGAASHDRMELEEVSLLPEFCGKGLGRYLTVRCLQKMYESYGGPGKYFFLGTDRRWIPALKLYHRLGFTIDRIESYAVLRNNSPDA